MERILKYAVIVSITGLVVLSFLVQYLRIPEKNICTISLFDIDKKVSVKGNISKTYTTNKTTTIYLDDCRNVTVFLYEKKSLEENSSSSVSGRKLARTTSTCFLYKNSEGWMLRLSGPNMATSLMPCLMSQRLRRRLSRAEKSGPLSRTMSMLTRRRRPSISERRSVSG